MTKTAESTPTRTLTLDRRSVLVGLPVASLGLACSKGEGRPAKGTVRAETSAAPAAPLATLDAIDDVFPLGAPPWPTFDPFLFCVHHDDAYPAGNVELGPAASLAGRNIGSDFEGKDGWRMYHGDVVPGFPRHPHRGFETVTVTRRGFIDHSDSLGATARYGEGDVQWMTAGQGIVHAEMFPLLDRQGPNPTELLQIWINLPSARKFATPYFSMFWQQQIPDKVVKDAHGGSTRIRVVAGNYEGERAPVPPPDSWAADAKADVAIWILEMTPGATFALPMASAGANRTLYFYRGQSLTVDQRALTVGVGARLRSDAEVTLVNGTRKSELLLLQGQPIAEPVVKRGPFVMNSQEQIQQAFVDYRRTQFGGWPWPGGDPVHPADKGRFAVHADGRVERAPA